MLKWLTVSNVVSCAADPFCHAPDLKSVLIGIFMNPGNVPDDMIMFRGQREIQFSLPTAALITLPWPSRSV